MLLYVAAACVIAAALIEFLVWPTILYFRDPKALRRFPNMSPLSGISNLPYMWLSARGSRSEYLTELHKAHPVLRIGPNSLSFARHTAVKDIYGHSSTCTKDDFYHMLSGTHFHLADVVDKAHHAQKRKILSSAYALKNLEGWEHKIADKISRVIKHFDKCCTAPPCSLDQINPEDLKLDYRAWTNFFTMDAIAEIGLSCSLGFTDKGNDEIICESLDGSQCFVSYRQSLHSDLTGKSHIAWSYKYYPYLLRLTNIVPYYRKLWFLGAKYDGIVYHQAKKRYERYVAGEKLDDFFQALMETKDGSMHGLEWGEIVAELSVMMNAGSVSTAIAINNVMYQLLKHPKSLARLREELDSNLGTETVCPYDRVKNLPYLRACLDESMRMLPPTPFNLPRKTPPEGSMISGDFIAGNTSVGMSAYAVHRDTEIFPNPETFMPERWLAEEGKELQPYFITFSAGSRGCLGRNISYLEQYMITATMLHRYDFALPSPDWKQQRYEHFNDVPLEFPLKIWRRHWQA